MRATRSTTLKLMSAGIVFPVVSAAPHYTFPQINADTADWTSVRQTANWQSTGPVTDVSTEAIRCYENSPGTAAPSTASVSAGGTITFTASPSIYHPGPLSAYMAKAPDGTSASEFDGSGAVWFKVYQDEPSGAAGQWTWPTNGQTELSFTVPACLEDGEYLFRVEHLALHSASTVNGAQFYLSCAQIAVTGGSGAQTPSNLVSFPGAYSADDAGILINIYDGSAGDYVPAGPAVFTC